jgi:hypothetical protein
MRRSTVLNLPPQLAFPGLSEAHFECTHMAIYLQTYGLLVFHVDFTNKSSGLNY